MNISREAVLQVIADESGKDRTKLVPEAKLIDLDISSLDLVSAVFTIEDKFGVLVEPSDVPNDATLGELIDFVMGCAQGKAEFRKKGEVEPEGLAMSDEKQ